MWHLPFLSDLSVKSVNHKNTNENQKEGAYNFSITSHPPLHHIPRWLLALNPPPPPLPTRTTPACPFHNSYTPTIQEQQVSVTRHYRVVHQHQRCHRTNLKAFPLWINYKRHTRNSNSVWTRNSPNKRITCSFPESWKESVIHNRTTATANTATTFDCKLNRWYLILFIHDKIDHHQHWTWTTKTRMIGLQVWATVVLPFFSTLQHPLLLLQRRTMVFLTSSCNCWHYLLHAMQYACFPPLLLLSLSHHYKLVYHIKNLLFQLYPNLRLSLHPTPPSPWSSRIASSLGQPLLPHDVCCCRLLEASLRVDTSVLATGYYYRAVVSTKAVRNKNNVLQSVCATTGISPSR